MAAVRKRIPQRLCVICRQVQAKRELIRLVRTPDAGVQVDPSGKCVGRGAYLCHNPSCWQKAACGDAISRALRTALTEEDRALIAAQGAQIALLAEKNE